jgi:hypothetical protein
MLLALAAVSLLVRLAVRMCAVADEFAIKRELRLAALAGGALILAWGATRAADVAADYRRPFTIACCFASLAVSIA